MFILKLNKCSIEFDISVKGNTQLHPCDLLAKKKKKLITNFDNTNVILLICGMLNIVVSTAERPLEI